MDVDESRSRYPAHWEADVVLRDGATASIRPASPVDAPALTRFFEGLSSESRYLRFFTRDQSIRQQDIAQLTDVDHVAEVTLAALVGEEIIGVAQYVRSEEGETEVAFTVSDTHHGRGVGSVLLEHLAAAARERGIHRFVAKVLPENRKMLGVFRDAGFEMRHDFEFGVVALEFQIDPTERFLAVLESREQRSEAASLRALLNPGSVAVVGASRNPASVGGRVLRHLLGPNFTGVVHPVNPRASSVQGVRCFPSVSAIGEPVDLAVLAVPADAVADAVRDCGAARVRGLVVMSGGFAEIGGEGVDRQQELVGLARGFGMRTLGPLSMGVLNTDPKVRLNASLSAAFPERGGLGLFSQSGALGLAVLASAARRRLGLSCFISAGNRADVSGNDCMQYMEEDPGTSVVGLYLESIGNPRKFSRIARRLSRSKPVVVVKSGVSGYGVPPGHSVRTSTAPREALDAMLQQAGAIRVDNVHQLLDVAQLLLHQPLPAGRRVGVVGNSVALAALVVDAATGRGLQIGAEPISVSPQATAAEFREALQRAYAQNGTDAVVACFVPPLAALDDEVVRALAEVSGASPKPTVACLMGIRGVATQAREEASGEPLRRVPAYPTPEDAVLALAEVVGHAEWLRRGPAARVDPAGIDRLAARSLVEGLIGGAASGEADIRPPRNVVGRLLACYGLALADEVVVRDEDEAIEAAERLGWPVVLLAEDPELRRSRPRQAIAASIHDADRLRAKLRDMHQRIPGQSAWALQPMPPAGASCVVRTTEDALFGPVLTFGLRGLTSDLLGDVAHRIPPLTDIDVADLIRSVRAAPLLTSGYRDWPPLDVAALEDAVARVSCLSDDLPEVAALEISPLIVSETGVTVADAAARLARPRLQRTEGPLRRLSR